MITNPINSTNPIDSMNWWWWAEVGHSPCFIKNGYAILTGKFEMRGQ
jgi:hypothetical protein